MLPDPLHPAVVHLPIALAVLMPLIAAADLVAIAKGGLPTRAWWAVVLLQLVLVGTAWLAVETGEAEEERVEKVVEEHHIHEHHDAAEWFLAVAGAGAVLMAAGLLPDRRGRIGRVAGALASLVVLATAVRTGHLGGELVYRHGAANAYTAPAPPPEPGP
jgi:uncharacterized membrane protein